MPASCPHLQPLGRQLCSIIQIGKRSIRNQLMLPLVRPPGPRNRGIIGNFPLGSRDPLGLYTQWARQYGDIFYYRAFNRYIYFLNRPDRTGSGKRLPKFHQGSGSPIQPPDLWQRTVNQRRRFVVAAATPYPTSLSSGQNRVLRQHHSGLHGADDGGLARW